jgi:hypothetical protein
VDEVYSDDLVYHIPPFPDLDKGGLRDFVTGFHQAFPDFSVEQDQLIVDENTTVQRWIARGPTAARTRCSRRLPLVDRLRPPACSWPSGMSVESWSCGTSATGWAG